MSASTCDESIDVGPPPRSPESRLVAGDEIAALLRAYRATGNSGYRNQVVERTQVLAIRIARGFAWTSEPLDDLLQVAFLGLVKAAERFDPDAGFPFEAFASVTVRGELRRHFRDHGWAVRVPRRLQELRYVVRSAIDGLSQELGRSPTTQEVAERTRVSADDVIDALCADSNYRTRSLDEHFGEGSWEGHLDGTDEVGYDYVDDAHSFREMAACCPRRLQTILALRYRDGMTQAEIGAELNISQVHVSRLLGEAHRLVREHHTTWAGAPYDDVDETRWGNDGSRERTDDRPPLSRQGPGGVGLDPAPTCASTLRRPLAERTAP